MLCDTACLSSICRACEGWDSQLGRAQREAGGEGRGQGEAGWPLTKAPGWGLVPGGQVLVGLSGRGELYVGPRCLSTDCTSLLLREGGSGGAFLLYTSKDLLYTVPLSELSSTHPLPRSPPLPLLFRPIALRSTNLATSSSFAIFCFSVLFFPFLTKLSILAFADVIQLHHVTNPNPLLIGVQSEFSLQPGKPLLGRGMDHEMSPAEHGLLFLILWQSLPAHAFSGDEHAWSCSASDHC